MDYLQKFNTTFSEFIDDIIQLFPNDSELKMYKSAISAAIRFNDKLAIEVFNESIVKNYGEQLLAKDESFFLSHDYSDVVVNKDYNAIIDKIKNCWTSMSVENKNIVWKYFRVLILLSQKIVI